MTARMKIVVGLAVLVAGAAIVWFGFGQQYLADRTVVAVMNETISRPEAGLSFTYPSGEAAFSLAESVATGSAEVLAGYVLMPSDEYMAYTERGDEPGETPAAISIFVFSMEGVATSTETATGTVRLERLERLAAWATERDGITSFSRAQTPPAVVEIDGVNAYRYRADGLYQQEVYIASYKNRAFLFVAQFNAETDLTYTAFDSIVQSMRFE